MKTFQVTTGLTTLVLLLVTLAISPIRKLAHWSELIRLRRMLGVAAFFYALVHALIYFILDQSLDSTLIWEDTIKHPRIAVGFIAFLLLVPLALTSTDGMIRRLGKRWGRLHRLVYLVTTLSIFHYLMVQKLDLREGLVFLAVFVGLMLFLPMFLAIALAIKLDSRGPVIYSQTRVGYKGKRFTMYKYRSMSHDGHKKYETPSWSRSTSRRLRSRRRHRD